MLGSVKPTQISLYFIISSMIDAFKKAEALFDYDTKDDNELSLRVGDVVSELSETGIKGWWQGRLGDKTGMFPSIFVVLIDEKDVPGLL